MFKSIQDVFDNYDMNYCKQVITLMNTSVKILLRVPCVMKLISERRNWVFGAQHWNAMKNFFLFERCIKSQLEL
jgi:hypothetical protein